MPLNIDTSGGGLPLDPATVAALQQQQLAQNVRAEGGSARTRQDEMAVGQGISNLFPSPEVQQARTLQQDLAGAKLTQNPGEGELDFSIRQLQAQRDAVAAHDPQAAAQMNTQLVKLANMKFEQSRLTAEDNRAQEDHDAKAPERALEQATGGYAYLAKINKDGTLASASIFDAKSPEETAQMQQTLAKDPSYRLLSQKDMAGLLRSDDAASRKLAQQLLMEQQRQKAGMLPEGTEGQLYLDTLIQPGYLSRMSTAAKGQLAQVEQKANISAAEKAGVLSEYKGMMAAVGNATKREANMRMFSSELQNEQGVLLDAAANTDRGSIAKVNQLMSQGKAGWADSGPEAAYAAALQTYVNTYARVVGGGTGVVSDEARREALRALSGGYLGPAGMKGATDMLSNKETQIINQASDDTVELFTNPTKYKNLISMQDKLRRAGYNVATTTTDDASNQVRSPPSTTPVDTSKRPALGSFQR